LRVRITSALAEHVHEPQEIGIFGEAAQHRVQMVRHEHVRNYFYAVRGGRTQKFAARCFGDDVILEGAATVQGAHGAEDAVGTDVEGRIEFRRSSMCHARGMSNPRAVPLA
jgi:hypothetical protein